MSQRIPRPLTAARVMLWIMTVLLLSGVLAAIIEIGGSRGFGAATVPFVLAVACGVYAYLLPRTGPVLLGVVATLLILFAFFQVNRITSGDPFGFLGLAYCVTLAVLLLLPSSRAAIRS